MDKHSTNETKIKIKINGEEQSFTEDMKIHNWNKGKVETAAGAENLVEEDEFDWILPDVDENQVGEFKKIYYDDSQSVTSIPKKIKRNGKSNIPTLIFSITTAITIGILIGFFMLKIVIYESKTADADKTTSNPAANNQSTQENSQNSTIPVPSLSAALIQGGIYKNAEPTANSIKAKGLPAMILEMESQQYIYIGVAGNIDTAKTLAADYKEQGVNVYAKEFTFKEKSLSKGTKDEGKLIDASISLFQTISQETANAYLTGQVNSQSLKTIGDKIEQIKSLKNIVNLNVKELRNNQVESYQALLNYQKNNDRKELLKGQQFLLKFIQQFNKLK